MKKNYLLALLMALFTLPLFTSCDDDDPWPGPGPGPGPNPGIDTYLDKYIVGQWDLVAANGDEVTGTAVNMFDFFSNGTGKYYSYVNGELGWEWIEWYCYDNRNNTPILHVTYNDGAGLNCAYTFNRDYTRLIMQWTENDGSLMTYTYAFTGEASAPARIRSLAAPAATGATVRPGTDAVSISTFRR